MTIQFYNFIPYIKNIKVRSCNHFCSGTAINITYSVCVTAAFVIQPAKLMLQVLLSSVASLGLQQFSTLSHKRHDFRKKKVIEQNMHVLIFSTTFV